jgi:hypothetical protein
MKLHEAIESGKRIRRVGNTKFWQAGPLTTFTLGDLSVEWEVEEQVRRVFKFQIFELTMSVWPLAEFDTRSDAEKFCETYQSKEDLVLQAVWRKV